MNARVPVPVVAALIEDLDGYFLLGRRPPTKSLPMKWEFPGGKIEAGETPLEALARDLDRLGRLAGPGEGEVQVARRRRQVRRQRDSATTRGDGAIGAVRVDEGDRQHQQGRHAVGIVRQHALEVHDRVGAALRAEQAASGGCERCCVRLLELS